MRGRRARPVRSTTTRRLLSVAVTALRRDAAPRAHDARAQRGGCGGGGGALLRWCGRVARHHPCAAACYSRLDRRALPAGLLLARRATVSHLRSFVRAMVARRHATVRRRGRDAVIDGALSANWRRQHVGYWFRRTARSAARDREGLLRCCCSSPCVSSGARRSSRPARYGAGSASRLCRDLAFQPRRPSSSAGLDQPCAFHARVGCASASAHWAASCRPGSRAGSGRPRRSGAVLAGRPGKPRPAAGAAGAAEALSTRCYDLGLLAALRSDWWRLFSPTAPSLTAAIALSCGD